MSQYIKRWLVPASNGSNHIVALDWNNHHACDCIGWIRHSPRIECRHIKMVLTGQIKEATELELQQFYDRRDKIKKTIKIFQESW